MNTLARNVAGAAAPLVELDATEPDATGAGRLRRGAGGALVVQGAGLVGRYASQVALARMLGAGAFGSYIYALNLSQLVAAPCDLGASSAAVRYVPEYTATADDELLAGFLRTLHVVPLALSCAVAAIGAALVVTLGAGPVDTHLALLALLVVPLSVVSSVYTSVTQGFHRIVWAYVPSLVLQPFILIAVAAAVFVAVGEFGSATAMVVTLASFGAAVVVQLVLVRQASAVVRHRRRRFAFRRWFSVSLPLLVTNLVDLVFQRVDVLMIGLMVDAKAAGIYAVAFRTATLATIFQVAMTTAIAPRISELHWSGRRRELEEALLAAVRLVLVPSVILTAILVGFGRQILGTFGHDFRAGWAALAVYSVGQLISVSCGPVGWFLNLTGGHRTAAWINSATALVAFVGYLVLIPPFGLVGAAAANSSAIALNNVCQLVVVRRRYGFRISPWRALVGSRRGDPGE